MADAAAATTQQTGTTQTSGTPAPGTPAPTPVPAAPAAGTPAKPGAPKSNAWKAKLNDLQQLEQSKIKVKTLEPLASAYQKLQDRLKTDPLGAIAELGLDWNTLAKAKVKAAAGGGGAPAPEAVPTAETRALAAKADELEKKVNAVESAQQNALQETEKARWNGYVSSVETAVLAKADEFPAIALFKATPLVIREITDHFAKTQKVLTPAEAAKAVEDRLQKELSDIGAKNPKIAALLSKGPAAPAAEEEEGAKRAPSAVGRPRPARTLAGGTSPGAAAAAAGAPIPKPPVTATAERKRAPSGVRGSSDEEFRAWREKKHLGGAGS